MCQRACEHVLACNRFRAVVTPNLMTKHPKDWYSCQSTPSSTISLAQFPQLIPEASTKAKAIVLAGAFNKTSVLLIRQHSVESQGPGGIQPARTPFAVVLPLRPFAQLHGSAHLLLHGDIMKV